MLIGEVVKRDVSTMPEKGSMGPQQSKYPFAQMTTGDSFVAIPEGWTTDTTDEKREEDLRALKKTLTSAVKQYERRLGKDEGGRKVKDFAVWVEDETVVVGCREDLSTISTQAPEASAPVKKSAKKSKQPAGFDTMLDNANEGGN